MTFLINKDKTYQPAESTGMLLHDATKAPRFHALQEWFYLKIYMHPEGINELLTGKIATFIAACRKETLISSWHYLRYKDPEDHLRLRLHCTEGRMEKLLNRLRLLMQELEEMHNIHDVLLAGYKPEAERYALAGLELTEMIFMKSSQLCQEELHKRSCLEWENELNHCLLLHAIYFLVKIMTALGIPERELQKICEERSLEYLSTQDQTARLKFHFDQEYRLIQKELSRTMKLRPAREIANGLLGILKVLAASNQLAKVSFAADIYHLHVNRLFSQDQKDYEAKGYYYLWKYLKCPLHYR